jgi:hypothetical protein
MRRRDKEIKDVEMIKSILREAHVCRLALSDNNFPYIVPMNFGFKGNILYLHSAKEGSKIEILRKNNNVCFEVDIKHELIKSKTLCDWSMKYYSVIGTGKAYLISDFKEKKQALDIIVKKYSSEDSMNYSCSAIEKLTVIKVEISKMTGRKSGY